MDITSSSQLKVSSSQEVVLNQDDDLLTLILLRVPCMKLMTLKCVSRRWHSLITEPHLTRLRNSLPLRASGLFIQTTLLYCIKHPNPYKVFFVPLDDAASPCPFRTLAFAHENPFDPENIYIKQSCNGLLLCSTNPNSPLSQFNCYVYNPSTNQVVTLPKHPHLGTVVNHAGLAFNPLKSPHYKVIAFSFRFVPLRDHVAPRDHVADIYIYSSETRTWRLSVQSFILPQGFHLSRGVYWNGSVHWLSEDHMKSISGWVVPDGLYFNVDEGRVEKFPRPPISGNFTSSRYFEESEDHLHFIEVCLFISVYEMKSDYSEWFIKYRIDLAPISKVFPEMTNYKVCFDGGNKYSVCVLSLVRRENFHEDSFLILEIPGKAIRYNLVDRSFQVIWDFFVELGLEDCLDHCFPLGMLQVSQYIETLSWV